jgi:hypothetical protein
LLLLLIPAILLAVFTTGLVGVPVMEAFAWRRRSQLRRTLANLPRHQIAAVLLPLREETGETRGLVTGLARELLMATEVSPADAPAGRGDEPTPTS